MADALVIDVEVRSSEALRAMSALDKANATLAKSTGNAAAAQVRLDEAIAKSGSGSAQAIAMQKKLDSAQLKSADSATKLAIAQAKAGEVTKAESAKAAAAVEAAAAKEVAAQNKAAAASAKVAAAAKAAATKQTAATKKIGTVAGGIGLLAAVGLGAAAKAASDFNAKMAQVQSISRASASDVAALSDATKNYASIGVSASQAADAEIELVKAGLSVKDILGGALTGTLNAAAAGQIDVAQATEIASAAMVQFGLAGKDIPHLADLLAAGADKSLGGINDLGEGLKAVGTSAHQFGLNIDETVGALSQFAAAGLTGSLGGTALKQALLKLEAPSAKAAALMKTYGISLYDASGNTVSLSDLAGQLQRNLGGVSAETRNAALATLFGSRAVQVANVLYKDGAKVTQQWVDKVNDSGFAAEQASGKMNSLQGDMQKLEATASNTAVSLGQKLQPALRGATQGATSLLGAVGGMSQGEVDAALRVLELVAALGLGVFAFSRIKAAAMSFGTTMGATSGKVAAGKGALLGLGIAMEAVSASMGKGHDTTKAFLDIAGGAAMGAAFGPFGALAGAAGGALQVFASQAQNAAAQEAILNGQTKTVTDTLNKLTGATTAATKATVEKQLSDSGAYAQASKLGLSLDTVTRAAMGQKGALDQVNASLLTTAQQMASSGGAQGVIEFGKSFGTLNQLVGAFGNGIQDAQKKLLAYQIVQGRIRHDAAYAGQGIRVAGGAIDDFGNSLGGAGHQAVNYSDDLKVLRAAAKQSAADLQKLADAILKLDQGALSKRAALRDYADAILAVDKAQKKAHTSLRESNVLLDQQASAALNAADTMKHGSQVQIQYLEHARTALYQQAVQFGMTKAEALKYVDQVLQIPTQWKTRIDIDNQAAMAKLRAMQTAYNQLQSKTITINVQSVGGGGGHAVYGAYASGGPIGGRGTGTSDSNLIRASKGEHMLTAKEVHNAGGHGAVMQMRRALQSPIPGRAAGGPVSRALRGSGPVGGSRTVVMTDPALLAEMQAVRTLLGARQHVVVDNHAQVAGAVGSVIDGAVHANAAFNAYRSRA